MIDVTVPLDLLLGVIGMAACEREWQSDAPRMQGTDMRPYVHKADCRPCALHALAVAQRGQEAS